MSDIALSAGVRSNLTTLKGISSMLSETKNRLATGKKVNLELDNPRNFFTARGMSDRANTLTGLQDLMSTAQQTVKAANQALETMTKFLQSARSLAEQAQNDQGAVAGREMTSTTAVTNGTGDTPRDIALSAELGGATGAGNGATSFVFTSVDETTGVESKVTFTVGTGTGEVNTVEELRDAVNASGIARMTVNENGTISFEAEGSSAFTVDAVGAGGAAFNEGFLGFTTSTAADTSGNGTNDAARITGTATTPSAGSSGIDYTTQIRELISQFDAAARDAGVNGKNLLAGGASNNLNVRFNEDGSSKLDIASTNMTTENFVGLQNFSTSGTGIGDFMAAIDDALKDIKGLQFRLGNDQTIVDQRSKFTDQLVNILQEGADNLTLADMNQEAANNLALQTRQQLGQTSLALSNQADQAVLQLLR